MNRKKPKKKSELFLASYGFNHQWCLTWHDNFVLPGIWADEVSKHLAGLAAALLQFLIYIGVSTNGVQ